MNDQEVIDEINEFNFQNNINNLNLGNLLDFFDEPKRKYTVRERIDPFAAYDDDEFRRRYRLSKAMVRSLYEQIDGQNTLEPMVRCIHYILYLRMRIKIIWIFSNRLFANASLFPASLDF